MLAEMILATQFVAAGQPPASLNLYTRWREDRSSSAHRQRVEFGLRVELMPLLFAAPARPELKEGRQAARVRARCARLIAARPQTPLGRLERRARIAVLSCGRPPC